MSHSFPPELQQLVSDQLATGDYSSEDEGLLAGVRLLADRTRQREELRRELQIGRDQLDRGEYTEYDEHTLRERFDQLKQRVQDRIEGHRNTK